MKRSIVLMMSGILILGSIPRGLSDEEGANIAYGAILKRPKPPTPFGEREAHAELRGRQQTSDTDKNGEYHFAIAAEIKKFQVIYTADGYASATSDPYDNNRGRQQLPDVYLTPLVVKSGLWKNAEAFKTAMDNEVIVYKETAVKITRGLIKHNVSTFQTSLQTTPTAEAFMPQRNIALDLLDKTLKEFRRIDETGLKE